MKFKRFFTLLITCMLALCLVACGDPNTEQAVANNLEKSSTKLETIVSNLEDLDYEDIVIENIYNIEDTNQNGSAILQKSAVYGVGTRGSELGNTVLTQSPRQNPNNAKYVSADKIELTNQDRIYTAKKQAYVPKYMSEETSRDSLDEYLLEIENMFNYCSDCVNCNKECKAETAKLEENLKECKILCSKLKDGTISLTEQEITECYDCMESLSGCMTRLASTKGNINSKCKEVLRYKDNFGSNTATLEDAYQKLLLALENRLDSLKSCNESFSCIFDIINKSNVNMKEAEKNKSDEKDIVDDWEKYETETNNYNVDSTSKKITQKRTNSNIDTYKAKNVSKNMTNNNFNNTNRNKNNQISKNNINNNSNFNNNAAKKVNNENCYDGNCYNGYCYDGNCYGNNNHYVNNNAYGFNNPYPFGGYGYNNYPPFQAPYPARNIDTYRFITKNIDTYRPNFVPNQNTNNQEYFENQDENNQNIENEDIYNQENENKQDTLHINTNKIDNNINRKRYVQTKLSPTEKRILEDKRNNNFAEIKPSKVLKNKDIEKLKNLNTSKNYESDKNDIKSDLQEGNQKGFETQTDFINKTNQNKNEEFDNTQKNVKNFENNLEIRDFEKMEKIDENSEKNSKNIAKNEENEQNKAKNIQEASQNNEQKIDEDEELRKQFEQIDMVELSTNI